MSVPILTDVTSLILTLIVIGIGYLSLFFGYVLARKQKDFFTEKVIKPTDKIIISFLIGSFSFLIISFGVPEMVNKSITGLESGILTKIFLFVAILIVIFSVTISWLVRGEARKDQNK